MPRQVGALMIWLLALWKLASCQYDTVEIEVDNAKHDKQFFTFLSRPDIWAPRWKIKMYDEFQLAPGYWFLATYGIVEQKDNTKPYVGPLIYDSTNGELVWSGAREFTRYATWNFKVSEFQDESALSLLQPHERQGVIIDNEYFVQRHIPVFTSDHHFDVHEFQVVDNGDTASWIYSYPAYATREESLSVGFDGECKVAHKGIIEKNITTDEVVFEWKSEGKIALNESYEWREDDDDLKKEHQPPRKSCRHSFDYLHMNSLEKLPDGDYLASGRRTYAIYKIARTDGSILWRLGGKRSDFVLAEGTHWTGQHDVRCLLQNATHMMISMMDNAWFSGHMDITNPNSRGLVVLVDLQAMTASEIVSFDHPKGPGNYAGGRGGMQMLPNGNAFVCFSDSALQSEHSPTGEILMESELYAGLKTYRAYKYPWIGKPQSPPDVISLSVQSKGETHTMVYVSWNGDTEATEWILYATEQDGSGSSRIASTRRTGFETIITCKGFAPFIRVEARDKNGNKLQASKSIIYRTLALPNTTESTVEVAKNIWQDLLSEPGYKVLFGVLFAITTLVTLFTVGRRIWKCAFASNRNPVSYIAVPKGGEEDSDDARGEFTLEDDVSLSSSKAEDDEHEVENPEKT